MVNYSTLIFNKSHSGVAWVVGARGRLQLWCPQKSWLVRYLMSPYYLHFCRPSRLQHGAVCPL